jgi:hypothetical protein
MLTNSEAAWLAARTQNRLMKDLVALPILSAPQPRSAAKPPVVPGGAPAGLLGSDD